jgi:peptidyl-dipeptidase Dcp
MTTTNVIGADKNPLLEKWDTPYQTPPFDLIKVEHIKPAIKIALKEAYAEVNAIIEDKAIPTFENTILALELTGKNLSKIAGVMYNLNSTVTSPELMKVMRDLSPKMSEFSSYVSLEARLFKKIKSIYEKRAQLNLDAESLKLLEDNYKGFVRSGANLKGDAKKRYAKISSELSQLTLQFGENVLNETNTYSLHITNKEDLKGLPKHVIDGASFLAKNHKKEGWMFNLQFPSFYPFIQYGENRELRKELYMAYNTIAFKNNEFNNETILKKIADLRLESAQLLGFKSYADYILDERMAESQEKVNIFLEKLHKASKSNAIKDFEKVKNFAKKSGFKGELKQWDWSYYTEKLKAKQFGFKEENVKPYFQLEKVQKGIFDLANTLYGIKFKMNSDIQVYHEDVSVYEVYDKDNSFLGVLYLDFFPRESKREGAWNSSFRSQSNVNNNMIRPLSTIVCNFTKPTENTPALLTFREVQTFLHEFGHALHGLFANTVYESMSGTSVYWDFVELPSQLMENFAFEKEWLDTFVEHYKTGEKIPTELVQKLISARNFLAGTASERQLSLGMCDMSWHSITKPVSKFSVKEIENKAMSATSLFPALKETSTSTGFRHIFAGGYAAGYYSYKWAEVLDADAFNYFKEKGIFNKNIATSFRENVLSKGGTEHPMKLYVKFRGQEPSIEGLLKRSGLNSTTTE